MFILIRTVLILAPLGVLGFLYLPQEQPAKAEFSVACEVMHEHAVIEGTTALMLTFSGKTDASIAWFMPQRFGEIRYYDDKMKLLGKSRSEGSAGVIDHKGVCFHDIPKGWNCLVILEKTALGSSGHDSFLFTNASKVKTGFVLDGRINWDREE